MCIGVLQQLSLDLKKIFPNETGFSYRNILYMKKWYSFYNEQVIKMQQVAAEMPQTKMQQAAAEMEEANRHQPSGELKFPDIFALVPRSQPGLVPRALAILN